MKRSNFILVIFILIFSGCSSSQREMESSAYKLDVELEGADNLDFNEYFSSVRYVPLETTKDVLIGEITKMYMTNKNIIIFDQKSMSIFLFDIDGKFVRKIGEKGEGPDEYLYINDIQFDEKRMRILAHERLKNKIYTYDLLGNLVNKSSKSSLMFNSFFETEEGVWVYSCFKNGNPKCYNLTLLSSDLQVVKKQYFPQKEFVNVTFLPTFVSDGHGRLFFYYPTSNVIYEISETNVIPFLQVNFGDRTMPYDKILKIKHKSEYDKLVLEKDYLGNISRCFINKERVFFSFTESGLGRVKSYECFYNSELNNGSVFKNAFMLSTKYPVLPTLLFSTDTTLVYQVNLSVITEKSLATLSETLSADVRIDSNPILAICYLKE